ncbi:Hpt domain-containing protein [Oceaniglobus trochenteri]|uniref:Hpt domain-containing protein n=1 Tax=Oceaniglobus trochenteri TaxID=2763260 RepID=UPI001D001116|nr:Hpt domain-containing protein [Oceaniglobus trochenteri]
MIAWKRVTQLRDEIGDPDFSEIVSLFLEEVDEVIEGLDAQDSQDSLGAAFHFLKGSAMNLGFQGFAGMCQEGENAAREGRATAEIVARTKSGYAFSRATFLAELDARLAPE